MSTPDPKHVDPYRLAMPDGKLGASGECSAQRPVLDNDKRDR